MHVILTANNFHLFAVFVSAVWCGENGRRQRKLNICTQNGPSYTFAIDAYAQKLTVAAEHNQNTNKQRNKHQQHMDGNYGSTSLYKLTWRIFLCRITTFVVFHCVVVHCDEVRCDVAPLYQRQQAKTYPGTYWIVS